MHRQVKDKTDEEKAKEFEEYFGGQAISVESVEDRCLLLCYCICFGPMSDKHEDSRLSE